MRFDDGDIPFQLKIRRILIPQMLYQLPESYYIDTLCRQKKWMMSDPYFGSEFYKISEIKLDEYYEITFYFIITSINTTSESYKISYSTLISHLYPKYSIITICNYIKLVGNSESDFKLFFKKFEQEKMPNWEFFEDTPLLIKPILYDKGEVYIFSKVILKAGIINLVPLLLKRSKGEHYKEHLGSTMESYVGEVMNDNGINFISEKCIKDIYRKNSIKGKVVDFLIEESDGYIFIDSKAIEPETVVKTSATPKQLKERLEGSFLKGLYQAQECAFKINSIGMLTTKKKISAIIVTHQDHFISSGSKVELMIDPSIVKNILTKYGSINIPLKNIHYITIDDMESLCTLSKERKQTITSILEKFTANDQTIETSKFNFSQHIQTEARGVNTNYHLIALERENLFNKMSILVNHKDYFWSGKVYYFLKCHSEMNTLLC